MHLMHPRQKAASSKWPAPSSAAISAPAATASSKVQKPRRHTSKTKLGLYHVSRRDFVARPASLPERERLLVLLRPGPLPTPDAGKASIHTQVLGSGTSDGCRNRILCFTVPLSTHARTTGPTTCNASVSRITVTCRVRNNRIICQSSDPPGGMAITLNQWILLTARAIQSDAVAPNARRGTRLPSPQVSRIAR